MLIKHCEWCKKEIPIQYKSWEYRKFCSRSCSAIYSLRVKKIISKEKHPLWTGDNVSYNSLHRWIQRNFGKPEECSHCKTKGRFIGSKKKTWNIHWANIDQKYKSRDRKDYFGLCGKCHTAYDKNKTKRCRYVDGQVVF